MAFSFALNEDSVNSGLVVCNISLKHPEKTPKELIRVGLPTRVHTEAPLNPSPRRPFDLRVGECQRGSELVLA